MVEVPEKLRGQYESSKLSQNKQENSFLYKALEIHIGNSKKLTTIHLMGHKLSKRSYECIGNGIKNSVYVKRLLIQNCNLAEKDNFHELVEGLMHSKSLQLVDFQMNNLQDRHSCGINEIIACQYEVRDQLRWKLGLRNPDQFDVSKLGIKSFILSRNAFTDKFAEKFASNLKADEYVKCVCLKKNNITYNGLKLISEACYEHPGILSLDLRKNPCYDHEGSKQFKKIMTEAFVRNLKRDILESKNIDQRIKVDWIRPACFGLENNHMDDFTKSDITPTVRRQYFAQFLSYLSKQIEMKPGVIVDAFMGKNIDKQLKM